MKRVSFGAKPRQAAPAASADQWVKSRQGEGESLKRLTIDIPVNLHKRVKSQCALQNLKMADVVRELLEQKFPKE